MPLAADFLQANDAANRLALIRDVLIAPPLNYGYYPAFAQYPGSTCLSFSTSVEMVLQVVRSYTKFGIKRFYVINIGISTTPILEAAASMLADEGVLLYYSDYKRASFTSITQAIAVAKNGGHADEIETSHVINIRPDLVHMDRGVLYGGKARDLRTAKTRTEACDLSQYRFESRTAIRKKSCQKCQ